jgi:putative membrane protein
VDATLVRFATTGLACAALMLAGFYLAQHSGGQRILRWSIARLTGAETWRALGTVDAVYESLATIYSDRSRIIRSGLVHLAGWVIGVLEVWIALAFMGHPIGIAEALVIESLLHAIRGVAFAIPGALGAQEAGLVLLCGLFGIAPEQAIALSLVKRAADLVLGVPSLLGWQALEWRRVKRNYFISERSASSVSVHSQKRC